MKIVWQREYSQTNMRGKKGFAVRKVIVEQLTGGFNDRVEYQISVSPKRTSWYRGFHSFQNARTFAMKGYILIG